MKSGGETMKMTGISRDGSGDRWCILRTTGPRTLRLAQSLGEAGIEAWTPTEIRRARLPRGKKSSVERMLPIAPTLVFARSRHLAELVVTRTLLASPHPGFSIFHDAAGRIPLIADRELEGLRSEEDRTKRRALRERGRVLAPGQRVRPKEGPFVGMMGIVLDCDGVEACLDFGRWFDRVKIDAWILEEDAVMGENSVTGIAA